MRAAAAALLALAACMRPGEERALAEREVGVASDGEGVTVTVEGGLAAVRSIAPGELALWAQAPVLQITLDVETGARTDWRITIDNALADAVLTGNADIEPLDEDRPTRRSWRVTLPAVGGVVTLALAPLDAVDPSPWRFAAMADIQTALAEVDEVFAEIDRDPSIRFVIGIGDLVQWGRESEYDLLEEQLATLDVPFYATIGNHELFGDPGEWLRRYGRMNVHFDFRGVAISLVDSGSATIDPIVGALLDTWLADARDRIHVFATHYPPIAPGDLRGPSSFASQHEAAALLERLAAGRVDVTLYGHVHTYDAYRNAGIPAHITGGGGALPVAFDGIDRHFLTLDVDPAAETLVVGVVRVDAPYAY